MRTKTRITLTINKEVHAQAKCILAELGLKQSTFVEVIYKALVDSETKPMSEVYGEVYGPLFERIEKYARAKKKKEKND